MPVERRGNFPFHTLRPYLESQGWDVLTDDTLIATREDAAGMFRLKVDKGGRVHLQRTFASKPIRAETVVIDDRTYATSTNTFTVMDVATQLENAREFPHVFERMMELMTGPTYHE